MELAEFLAKRKKAASWWDHSHITRRLATNQDARDYRRLPAEKRYVLLQAARFSATYYSVAAFPALGLGLSILISIVFKQADIGGVPIDVQISVVAVLASFLMIASIVDLFEASRSTAHARTWVAAFEDIERELAAASGSLGRRKWTAVKSRPRTTTASNRRSKLSVPPGRV